MSDDHSVRTASLEARLSTVEMDIDDDDEDVVLVTVDMTNEAADLLFHMMVLLEDADLSLADVISVLQDRHK